MAADVLRNLFEAAVDDLLQNGKAQATKSEKPAPRKLMQRPRPVVLGAAMVAAQASSESLNQWAFEVQQKATHARKAVSPGSIGAGQRFSAGPV